MAAPGASSAARVGRRRPAAAARTRARLTVAAIGLGTIALLLGLVFAGPSDKLADGTRIAGIDVGGLSTGDATRLLERRAARLQRIPVTFTAGSRRWRVQPGQLGVSVDWRAAVASAQRQGGGFGPVRGYRRLELKFLPANLEPPTRVYDAALQYEIGRFAKAVDSPHREARLVRHGLSFAVDEAQTGRVLDREAAARVVVRSLASFDRAPVGLPVRTDPPEVTAADLEPAVRAAETAVSAPITLALDRTRLRLPRWRVAQLLELPADGRMTLRLRGPAARRWLAQLARGVDRAPRNADWAVTSGGGVRVVPAVDGLRLDRGRTADVVLAAAERPTGRVAELVVARAQPHRSTAEARALGIVGLVGSYETVYGGDPNRIHNVQLVAHLVDHKLIAPGTTFSFNGATGERTAAKGFREAQVIINGELQTGLGGGVCQVSTTVFNAAYEAGLPITARTNHALYISHYPLGRDATVNYPDTDLKFVNDTGHWLLLRTFVGSYSLTVGLYGVPQHRRVVTDAQPLDVVAPPLVRKTPDPALVAGEVVVDDEGVPSQATSVRRRVYASDGKLLSDASWLSSYRSEPKLVRVGTKKEPKPVETTTTDTTSTDTTSTGTTTTGTTTTTPTETVPPPAVH